MSTCRQVIIPYTDDDFRTDCSSKKHTVDLDELLTNTNKDKFVGNTGLTIAQIEAKLDRYISGLQYGVNPIDGYDTWLPTTAYRTAYQITLNDTMIEFGYIVSGYMAIHDTRQPTVASCQSGRDFCQQVSMKRSGKILISKLPK